MRANRPVWLNLREVLDEAVSGTEFYKSPSTHWGKLGALQRQVGAERDAMVPTPVLTERT